MTRVAGRLTWIQAAVTRYWGWGGCRRRTWPAFPATIGASPFRRSSISRPGSTEADVRLFTTLVRFDPVYHSHFKCNRQKLTEMPVLWAYARDLFQTPGFGDTIDFDHIKRHYYQVHQDINPTGIVPAGPDLAGWTTPHGRERLGGRPFGSGTPPSPPSPRETVPPGHNPLAA